MHRKSRPARSRPWRRASGPCAVVGSAAGAGTSARREEGDGQDAFLRRHAAMKKRAAISALILAELRWIDKESIASGEQRVGAKSAARQLQRILIGEGQRISG